MTTSKLIAKAYDEACPASSPPPQNDSLLIELVQKLSKLKGMREVKIVKPKETSPYSRVNLFDSDPK